MSDKKKEAADASRVLYGLWPCKGHTNKHRYGPHYLHVGCLVFTHRSGYDIGGVEVGRTDDDTG